VYSQKLPQLKSTAKQKYSTANFSQAEIYDPPDFTAKLAILAPSFRAG